MVLLDCIGDWTKIILKQALLPFALMHVGTVSMAS